MTSPDFPAFSAIFFIGALKDFNTISYPTFSSSVVTILFNSLIRSFCALTNDTPPPGKIPSSNAALVAQTASSTRSFFSLTSVSVAPPTLITATPPINLASLSRSFSLSYDESVF